MDSFAGYTVRSTLPAPVLLVLTEVRSGCSGGCVSRSSRQGFVARLTWGVCFSAGYLVVESDAFFDGPGLVEIGFLEEPSALDG